MTPTSETGEGVDFDGNARDYAHSVVRILAEELQDQWEPGAGDGMIESIASYAADPSGAFRCRVGAQSSPWILMALDGRVKLMFQVRGPDPLAVSAAVQERMDSVNRRIHRLTDGV